MFLNDFYRAIVHLNSMLNTIGRPTTYGFCKSARDPVSIFRKDTLEEKFSRESCLAWFEPENSVVFL